MAKNLILPIFKSKFIYPLFVSLKRYSSQAILKTELNASNEKVSKLSTLFVPSKYGSEMYQIVKPVIDINYISENLANLKLSCDHRGIDIDLDYTLEVTKKWSNIRNDYLAFIKKEQECTLELSNLNSINDKRSLDAINEERKKLIKQIVEEKNKLHNIEDVVMPLLQKIPHILHSSAPLQFDVVNVCQKGPNLEVKVKHHTDIASHLLEFTNNSSISYFLIGRLSELDFAIQQYFTDKVHELGFYPLSCMDFCKSFIIEAIGYDPYSKIDCIQIKSKNNEGQKLNLIGGASLESFCAYLTNMNVNVNTLPLRYFSLGRRYTAANNNNKVKDLFSVVQSTNVHCIILSEPSSKSEFDFLLESFITCYSELNIPYKIVNISAKNLTVAESRRKQIELWSPALKDYVPVAYVSQHDDFISKRLQITYGVHHCKEGYCSIVEGAVVNTSVLIGCIIENFQTKTNNFGIPDVLKNYISSLHE